MPSCTGAPEGDPTSVLGMTAVCWMFVSMLDQVQPRAFVDSWLWTARDRNCHKPAIDSVLALTDSLRMEVDWAKAYCWATTRKSRVWFKQNAAVLFPPGVMVPILPCVRELGAHVQFTRRTCLGHLPDLFQESAARLKRLFHSPAPLEAKALVIQNGVWPHAFFGTCAVAPGKHRVHGLRSLAARALIGRHHTLSPYASMHLAPTADDPEVYLLVQQVRQLQRAGTTMPEVAREVLRLAAKHWQPLTVRGPGSAMHAMFARNEWVIKDTGWFHGPGHFRFHVFDTSMSQVVTAIREAWGLQVQEAVRDRAGLRDIGIPTARPLVALLRDLSPWKQQIVMRHSTGAFMSAAEKSTWSRDTSEHCPLCGQLDTKGHRLFACPALRSTREPYLDLLEVVQKEFPAWVHLFTATEHPDLPMFRLISQTRTLPEHPPLPEGRFHLEIFTDGSARHSTCAEARLTYWSAVLALGPSAPVDVTQWVALDPRSRANTFRIVGMGSTPGAQTVPRAELAAVCWVARWLALDARYTARVFCDCQFVVDLWEKLAGPAPPHHIPHFDLAKNLVGCGRLQVVKVKGHNQPAATASASPWLQWAAAGNDAADAAAKVASRAEMPLLIRLSEDIAEHVRYESDHMTVFAQYLVEQNVAEARLKDAFRAQQAEDTENPPGEAIASETVVRQRYGEWRSSPFAACPPSRVKGLPWGDDFVGAVVQWARQLQWPELPCEARFDEPVAYLELLVHFCCWSRTLPPVAVQTAGGRVFHPALSDLGRVQPRSLEEATGVFVELTQTLCRRHSFPLFPTTMTRRVFHLRALGLDAVQLGLALRPNFPEARDWIPVLREVCATRRFSILERVVLKAT